MKVGAADEKYLLDPVQTSSMDVNAKKFDSMNAGTIEMTNMGRSTTTIQMMQRMRHGKMND